MGKKEVETLEKKHFLYICSRCKKGCNVVNKLPDLKGWLCNTCVEEYFNLKDKSEWKTILDENISQS